MDFVMGAKKVERLTTDERIAGLIPANVLLDIATEPHISPG